MKCRASAGVDARRAHGIGLHDSRHLNRSLLIMGKQGVQGCGGSFTSGAIRRHGFNETEPSPPPELQTNPQYDRPILSIRIHLLMPWTLSLSTYDKGDSQYYESNALLMRGHCNPAVAHAAQILTV